jgi:hypothetical protein
MRKLFGNERLLLIGGWKWIMRMSNFCCQVAVPLTVNVTVVQSRPLLPFSCTQLISLKSMDYTAVAMIIHVNPCLRMRATLNTTPITPVSHLVFPLTLNRSTGPLPRGVVPSTFAERAAVSLACFAIYWRFFDTETEAWLLCYLHNHSCTTNE